MITSGRNRDSINVTQTKSGKLIASNFTFFQIKICHLAWTHLAIIYLIHFRISLFCHCSNTVSGGEEDLSEDHKYSSKPMIQGGNREERNTKEKSTKARQNIFKGKWGQNREAQWRDCKTNRREDNRRAYKLLTARPVPVNGTNIPIAAIMDKEMFPTLSNSIVQELLLMLRYSKQGSIFSICSGIKQLTQESTTLR